MDRVATAWGTCFQADGIPSTLRNDSDSEEIDYQKALDFHRRDRLGEAEAAFRDILARNSTHAGAIHFLGLLCQRTDRPEEALEQIERSVELDPGNAVFRNNYGIVLQEVGRNDEAETAFREAVRLDPGYVDARSNFGVILLAREKFEEAERELEAALKIDPGHKDASKHLLELRMRRGHKYAVQENFAEANRCFHLAASMTNGKELWRWKSLGFCPTIFRDENDVERYWDTLHRSLDLALRARLPLDWRTLPSDGFCPSFNLPHLGKCCREIREKFARLFVGCSKIWWQAMNYGNHRVDLLFRPERAEHHSPGRRSGNRIASPIWPP